MSNVSNQMGELVHFPNSYFHRRIISIEIEDECFIVTSSCGHQIVCLIKPELKMIPCASCLQEYIDEKIIQGYT